MNATGEKPEWYDDWEARFPEDTWRDIGKLNEFVSWVKSTWTEQATNETFDEPIVYKINTNVSLTNYQNDTSYTSVKEVINGNETGNYIMTFTKDTPAYRLTKFRAEAPQYMEMQSATYYYLFTLFFLMIDSRAKNMFIGFHGSPAQGLQYINRKTVFEIYDADTAMGTNNSGVLKFGYYHLDTDTVSNIISGGDDGGSEAPVFNGQDSVLWMNFHDTFWAECESMYRDLRANRAWTYDRIENLYEEHQSKWPEAMFNEDSYIKYLVPLIEPVTVDEETGDLITTDRYLTMLQGSKELQRKWWLYNRFRYFDSMFHTGSATTSFIEMRLFNTGTLHITPAVDLFVTVTFGRGSTPNRIRTTAGNAVDFPYTVTSSTTVTEMETTIFSADLISDVGDLSVFYGNEFDFSRATKLRRLKLGDASPSYSNANLTTVNVSNCFLLEEIDCRNCGQLSITMNLEGSPRLERAYFDGTSITGIDLVDGAPLEVLHLPGTITTLMLLNHTKLVDFQCPSFANVSRVMLSNIDQSVLDPIDVLSQIMPNSQVNIQGMDLVLNSYTDVDEFYNLLDSMTGVSRERNAAGVWIYNGYDNAQVSGHIHVNGNLTGLQVYNYLQRYPYIEITANRVVSQLRYMTWDGSSVLKTVQYINGETSDTAPPIPLRDADQQYTFTPIGWNKSMDAGEAQSDANLNVFANRDIYAAYRKTLKTYTVTWKNIDGTNLEIDRNVPYGQIPEYNGEIPRFEDQDSTGWNPDVSAVTGDITYFAKYQPVYTVWWKNIGGETLKTERVVQDRDATPPTSTPVYDGDDPDGQFVFDGWQGVYTNIQEDTTIIARYRDTSPAVIKYLRGTLDVYESTTNATQIGSHGIQNQNILTSVKTFATTINDYAIYDNINLKTIDLANTSTIHINGSNTFVGNRSLDSLIIRSNSMPSLQSVQALFRTTLTTGAGAVFVPSNKVDVYKADPVWSKFTIASLNQYPLTDYSTISDSWDTIIANNNYSVDYKIGDTKLINLGSFGKHYMQLVAIDEDSLEDNTKARMTWLTKGIVFKRIMSDRIVETTVFSQDGSSGEWYTTNQGIHNSQCIGSWAIYATSSGTININYKVSSEQGFDFLTVLINSTNVTRHMDGDLLREGISGDIDYISYPVEVNAGDVVAVYAKYQKDNSTNRGDDTGYLEFSGSATFNVTYEYANVPQGEKISGWQSSVLRSYLKTQVLQQIPENIRNAIVPVSKITSSYDNVIISNGQITIDDIWIPSHHELGFGTTRETSGPVYSVAFNNMPSRHKYNPDTDTSTYWTRSVNDSMFYMCVDETGNAVSVASYGEQGVVFGFCI